MSLANTIKALQKTMRKDAGIDGDAQRIGQLGWLLFLKIYSDLELETELSDNQYVSPTPSGLRWQDWADEKILGKDSLTGDALINFVNNELFPALKNLDLSNVTGQARARGKLLISVFDDTYNYMKNGTLLRQVINKINQDIDFNTVETRHLFGDIYEQILKDLQSAGNAGEYYTPRAITQFAVDMLNPKLGEIVLDPACGTGGFLTCAFEVMKQEVKNPIDFQLLKNSLKGIEKKQLPHTLCATNMMIHGIEVPSNIVNDNTLSRQLRDYKLDDQVDIIFTNPPFGGVEEDGIENNFPSEFRTKETADLFVTLVVELLKTKGRAIIVLPDAFLEGDGVKSRIKEHLLKECNLHTIVRLPDSVFKPYANVRTNLLFLEKGTSTKNIWYYDLILPLGMKSFSKTKPIKNEHFDLVRNWWGGPTREGRFESEDTFEISIETIRTRNYNLDFENPNRIEPKKRSSQEIIVEKVEIENSVISHFEELKQILKSNIKDERKEYLSDFLSDLGNSKANSLGYRATLDFISKLALAGWFTTDNDLDESAEVLLSRIRDISGENRGRVRKKTLSLTPREDLIPKKWVWTRSLEVFETLSEGNNKIPTTAILSSGKYPVVDQGKVHIRGFHNDLSKVIKVDSPLIIFGDHTREVKYVDFDFTVGADGVKILKPILIDSRFAFHALKSLNVKAKGYGRHFSRLADTWLALPPIEEQVRITKLIDHFASICDQIAQKSEVAANLNSELFEAITTLPDDLDDPSLDL